MRDSNVVSAEERYDPFRFGVKKLILIMSRFIVVHLLDDETKQDRGVSNARRVQDAKRADFAC